jgi:hypothetical protein
MSAVAPMFATCGHRTSASFVMALAGGCVAPRNYHSAAIKWPEMIRVVLTDEAYDAIADVAQGRGTVAAMLHPSRGGRERPHEAM